MEFDENMEIIFVNAQDNYDTFIFWVPWGFLRPLNSFLNKKNVIDNLQNLYFLKKLS